MNIVIIEIAYILINIKLNKFSIAIELISIGLILDEININNNIIIERIVEIKYPFPFSFILSLSSWSSTIVYVKDNTDNVAHNITIAREIVE